MDEYERTPADEELIRAINRNNLTGVEDVLTQQYQNMNINHVDVSTRVTPLILAIMYCAIHRIIQMLLHHGADPNVILSPSRRTGRTALHYCRSPDHQYMSRCIRLLLDNNANVNIQDETGDTCLFYAIESASKRPESIEIIRLLLNFKVDVNLQVLRSSYLSYTYGDAYVKGDTILHCAVRVKNIEIVNMILEYCDTSPHLLLIHNSDYETAYDIAQQFNHIPIMKCLKMTLLLQCHLFLRQKWIMQIKKPTITTFKDEKFSRIYRMYMKNTMKYYR